jgi:muconolactone D-isomerase
LEFLVAIDVRLPHHLSDEEVRALTAAERERGATLRAEGTIQRIWRVPGRMRNLGIWSAPDATALHAAIASLPLARWFEVDVTPLAVHPLEESRDD